MFLLSTDGYRNAHGSGPGSEYIYRTACYEFADALQNQDCVKVFADLPATLNYASANGSGDDITLGLVWRPDAVNALPPRRATAAGARFPPSLALNRSQLRKMSPSASEPAFTCNKGSYIPACRMS